MAHLVGEKPLIATRPTRYHVKAEIRGSVLHQIHRLLKDVKKKINAAVSWNSQDLFISSLRPIMVEIVPVSLFSANKMSRLSYGGKLTK